MSQRGRRESAGRRRRAAAGRCRDAARPRAGPRRTIGSPRPRADPTSRGCRSRCRRARGRSRRGTPRAYVALLAAQRPEFRDLGGPARRDRLADAPQHDLLRDPVELHVATGRQEREALSTCRSRSRRVPPSSARYRRSNRNSLRCVPTKSSTVQTVLPGASEPAAELLQEQRRALGRPQHQDVSTSGTSTPSLNRSTEKTTWMRPARRSRRASSSFVSRCLARTRRPRRRRGWLNCPP